MPAQRPHRSKQDYATPRVFLDAVKQRLKISSFAFDFAADASNAVAARYWTVADNSLSQQSWAAQLGAGWGWLNPPYTTIGPWADRCALAGQAGGSIAFLVPASVGANWFRDAVDGHARVLALNGRLGFMPEHPAWLYPKDCILALYGPRVAPGFEVWTWNPTPPRAASPTVPRSLLTVG